MPKALALMVVQRHSAASRSARPSSTGQHWYVTSPPMMTCTSPPRRSTHASSFRVSMGHVGALGGGGHGTEVGGGRLGVGYVGGGGELGVGYVGGGGGGLGDFLGGGGGVGVFFGGGGGHGVVAGGGGGGVFLGGGGGGGVGVGQ